MIWVSKLKKKLNRRVNILLTRPKKDSLRLSQSLDKKKFKCFVTPLLNINKIEYSFNERKQYDFVIFTSKNGLNNFQLLNKKTKIIVIGDGTYLLAKELGLEKIINIKGNLNDLKEKIRPLLKKNFKILHPTSNLLNQDLKEFFKDQGCFYQPIGCYKSIMVNPKSEIFENFFNSCKDGLITLFSRRTAISFKNQISRLGLLKSCVNKKILVLSNLIAAEIKEVIFKEVFICNEPNEKEMLKLIERISQEENSIE